jgi:hypothetical protein
MHTETARLLEAAQRVIGFVIFSEEGPGKKRTIGKTKKAYY